MHIKYKLFWLLLLFIFPLNSVFASSNIYIDCPNSGGVGDSLECELFATSDIEISALRTKLSVSDNLEVISFKTDSSWQGSGDNGDISLYTYPNQIGKIKLGIVTIKIKENNTNRTGTLYFKDVYFYKADFSKVASSSISKNIKILSNNNDLDNLSLVGYNITPKFNKDTTKYQAVVDNDVVVIEAIPKDKNAIVSGNGRKEIKYGENVFVVTVTSEIGTKKEYKVIINRISNVKKENQFSNYNNQKIETNNKDNSNDNSKDNNKDNDIKLKSLTIDGYNLDFDSDTYCYNIDVSNNVDKLVINASSNNDKAKIIIDGNENLKVGRNEIKVTVEAEDGSKIIYTIYVTKKSNICVIKLIKITNYDLNFDCNKYDYELKIDKEKSLKINVIPTSDKVKINIYNNENLKNGDTITISANDGDIDYEYHIKVLKNDENTFGSMSNKLLILIFFSIICLLCLVGRSLIKRKNK